MDDSVFAARIEEARKKIDSLPEDQRDPLLKLLAETCERHVTLRHGFDRLRNLLQDWRVKIKYLTFDVEASRRELADLRRKQQED